MPKDVPGLISLFDLTQIDDGLWEGPQPDTYFQRLFGGQVLAQTLVAAARSVPQDRCVHSLNAYFLRPGSPEEPLRFEVEALRDGSTFSARRVVTKQFGKIIFQLNASFQEAEPGLEHSARQPWDDVTPAADAPALRAVLEEQFGSHLELINEWDALDVRLATEPSVDERGANMRVWVRTRGEMPPDPLLHNAVLAYLSDMTLLAVTVIPHKIQLMSPRLQSASIDHAMWFHRPVKVDEWVLYDMISPSAAGARGFSRGRLYQNGVTIASCGQEGLIRLL
ncbi:acyl-CoA thioesterase II [Tessaracoccus sp. OH4464_COT-324]|uniref:acyl-CoA thioesterase n=1 Tax=Tessaracoccus sp. OH4464_COT-324 TaxID=2491059 RepID=UPI000F63D49B|nr:acyl-CoA thioesterase II [Tessaracoccus sp. OH4464_COT-324]RRD47464.1 acyl-CoA thioesterase II [Tessaracoccus sp. OH4464_COT-324]